MTQYALRFKELKFSVKSLLIDLACRGRLSRNKADIGILIQRIVDPVAQTDTDIR